ncbi:MAG: VWA domain-containing protein [Opitutales bacterium]|nr:VWA domain-containing protein [Opitutales bacterium]MCH8539553.1 VWA domain-containing protein [Opitutales bacterium]
MLTFQNPAFLFGLLLLAVPIFLHLIHRTIFRPQKFPSLRFILKGKFPLENKRRLRDILLLACRLLLLALLIGFLAGPRWTPPEALADSAADQPLHIFFVDASASMSGWDQMEIAREEIRQQLADLEGAPVALLVSADRPLVEIPPTTDHQSILRALTEAEAFLVQGQHRESLQLAYRWANDFLSSPGANIHLHTDRQNASWNPSVLPAAPSGLEWHWHQPVEEPRANTAILSVRLRPAAEERQEAVVEIRHFGESERQVEAELHIGDQTITRSLNLLPNQTTRTIIEIDRPTSNRGRLSLEADDYPADDTYHFWAGPTPPVEVTLLDREGLLPSEEAFFLERTLEARSETHWQEFNPNVVQPETFSSENPEQQEVIFLLGTGDQLDDSQWEHLESFVAEGGLLLITTGQNPARQNNILRQRDLLNLETIGVASATPRSGNDTIDWINPETPLGRLFDEEDARALLLVNLFRHARIRVDPEEATTLLRNRDEEPLLIEKPFHDGRIVYSAIGFDTSWSDLPLSGAFLPLIREIMATNLSEDHGIQRVATHLDRTPLARSLQLTPDALALADLSPDEPQALQIGEQPVEINVPREESDPTPTPLDEIEAALMPRGPSPQTAESEEEHLAAISISWRPYLLFLAVAFFLMELFFAASGRPTRSPSKNS